VSASETLPTIRDDELVEWEITDPTVRIGDDWIRPTRLDMEQVRAPELAPIRDVVNTTPQEVTEAMITSGELHVPLCDMLRGVGGGVGIAAPQVNSPLKLYGIRFDPKPGELSPLTFLANPTFYPDERKAREYMRAGQSASIDVEGCLTLHREVIAHPPRYHAGEVDAGFEIVVVPGEGNTIQDAYPREWNPKYLHDEPGVIGSINARITQHEIDHFDGLLFPDEIYTSVDIVADPRYMTGSVYWIHKQHYPRYLRHLREIREVLRTGQGYSNLPVLPFREMPYDQYEALREGKIVMPKPAAS
jgi:peptide deformylase